jgi:hypothetical protein
MAVPQYIMLKCVPAGGEESDEVTRTLTVPDLEAVARADSTVYWGEDPKGTLPVKNTDGSVTMMKTYLGFSFTPTPGMDDFFICYEFSDGICIHTERQDDVCRKCAEFAVALGATAFPTY